jgi:hypothetical protein
MKWSYEGNIGKSSALKAKEIGVIIGKKILILTSQAGYVVGRIIVILFKRAKATGKQEGEEIANILRRLAVFLVVKTNTTGKENAIQSGQLLKKLARITGRKAKSVAKDAGVKSRPLLKELAIMISVQANKAIEQTKRGIKADMKATKASNLAKRSEELPEIVTKRVNLNESLAQSIERIGIDCEAIEVNSLAIENRPYYSSKLPMSPKIVTNRGCIKVNGKSFGLIQIIQRN